LPHYFKTSSFATYNGSGWASITPDVQGTVLAERRSMDDYRTEIGPNGGVMGWPEGVPPALPIDATETTTFEIKLIEFLPASPMPAPGPLIEVMEPQTGMTFSSTGQALTAGTLRKDAVLKAVAITPEPTDMEDRESALPDTFQPLRQIYNDT